MRAIIVLAVIAILIFFGFMSGRGAGAEEFDIFQYGNNTCVVKGGKTYCVKYFIRPKQDVTYRDAYMTGTFIVYNAGNATIRIVSTVVPPGKYVELKDVYLPVWIMPESDVKIRIDSCSGATCRVAVSVYISGRGQSVLTINDYVFAVYHGTPWTQYIEVPPCAEVRVNGTYVPPQTYYVHVPISASASVKMLKQDGRVVADVFLHANFTRGHIDVYVANQRVRLSPGANVVTVTVANHSDIEVATPCERMRLKVQPVRVALSFYSIYRYDREWREEVYARYSSSVPVENMPQSGEIRVDRPCLFGICREPARRLPYAFGNITAYVADLSRGATYVLMHVYNPGPSDFVIHSEGVADTPRGAVVVKAGHRAAVSALLRDGRVEARVDFGNFELKTPPRPPPLTATLRDLTCVNETARLKCTAVVQLPQWILISPRLNFCGTVVHLQGMYMPGATVTVEFTTARQCRSVALS